MTTESPASFKDMLAIPFSIIPPTETDPLWPGWVLRRHVTILVAPGGTGKGLLTIDMAARVTRGGTFPGEDPEAVHEPANVILVAPEDDPNEAVAHRLKAANADLTRVYNLTVLPDGSPFNLPDSVPLLRQAMEDIGDVALVIIDPLYACVSKPVTTNAAARRVTGPLERLANQTGCAIVLTHHTVKSGATAGAKGLTDSVRCVLRIDRPRDAGGVVIGGDSSRVLSVEKANVLSDEETLRYVISGEGNGTALVWPSEVEAVSAQLSSRGYSIDPDMLDPQENEDYSGEVELYRTAAGKNACSLGKFVSSASARTFAGKQVSGRLNWKAGPVEGSVGAATQDESGDFAYYSVMPVS